MSDKRKKDKFAAKREQRRLKQLSAEGRLVSGVELPRGAVLADQSQQVPNNSYSPPPEYYVDIEYTCSDCGRHEVWTAKQQKWYYEVAKGSLYATAVRCRECRRKQAEQHTGRGDPNPIKHEGSLLKHVRREIEPSLVEAGFQFDGKSAVADSPSACLDYSRPGFILSCFFDSREGLLIAEAMNDLGECIPLANTDMCGIHSTPVLLERVDEFTSTIQDALPALHTKLREAEGGDA